MDFSIIQKLAKEPKYSTQKDEYRVKYTPKTPQEIRLESAEILTQTEFIHFYPNSWDLRKKVNREVDGKTVEQLYDPKVDEVLKNIATMVGTFGMATIIIEGHADSSMKGRVPAHLVKELSLNRANAVKEALVATYNIDPDQLTVDGVGWDRPLDPNDPMNQAKNRRVEIKVYPAEMK
jgi:outer membrane protein OmpA-like peptidoglycan-associated protein